MLDPQLIKPASLIRKELLAPYFKVAMAAALLAWARPAWDLTAPLRMAGVPQLACLSPAHTIRALDLTRQAFHLVEASLADRKGSVPAHRRSIHRTAATKVRCLWVGTAAVVT